MTFPILGKPVDERTAALGMPLPSLSNYHEDDVPRMRMALELIDTAMQLMGLDMDSRDAALAARTALLEWTAARASKVTYAYDANGRVSTATATVAGMNRATTFTYDAQGRVATARYGVAGGATRTETFTYDANGRMASVTAAEAP